MKIMISSPCAGGMLYDGYVNSLQYSIERAKDEGLLSRCDIHFQGKESLIHRARNRAANYFLRSEAYDKLLTIDADIVWTYEDLKRILTSDKDIVGGIYPIKAFPVVANFIPLPDRGTELFKSERGLDLLAMEQFERQYADPETGEAEVLRIPTGFMCVTQKVLAKLSETCEVYGTLDTVTGRREGQFHFYPSDVKDYCLRSEDFGMCDLAREAGFKIYINTRIKLGHIGTHCYRLGQIYGQVD